MATIVPAKSATESIRRLVTGASASNRPTVSITRGATECGTPNNGPSWRMVRFVRE